MISFREKVFRAVQQIPKGKVATYGDIAKLIGCAGGARAVGNALHQNTDCVAVPCHRVVNSKGALAKSYVFGGVAEQAKKLLAEGVNVWAGKVNLKQFRAKF